MDLQWKPPQARVATGSAVFTTKELTRNIHVHTTRSDRALRCSNFVCNCIPRVGGSHFGMWFRMDYILTCAVDCRQWLWFACTWQGCASGSSSASCKYRCLATSARQTGGSHMARTERVSHQDKRTLSLACSEAAVRGGALPCTRLSASRAEPLGPWTAKATRRSCPLPRRLPAREAGA